ncbi:MAG: TIGR02117 family protein [Sphingobacteriales bacterium]|nr:MAG: TIGR02117 family protein [Sphingobacteriales bacterium]
MKRLLKIVGKMVLGLIVFVGLYALAALSLSAMAVNRNKLAQSGVPMYLLSNGVHLDIVVPVKHPKQDWSALFPYRNTQGQNQSLEWIGLGWGDKGFYLHTPTWADLTFPVAFRAATGLSSSALHATYMNAPKLGDSCRFLYATEAQYQKLVAYTKQALDLDSSGNPIWIQTDANYGADDAFYEAKGSYSAFRTCNTWTNKGLKQAGLPACVWTPMAGPVLKKYPKETHPQ